MESPINTLDEDKGQVPVDPHGQISRPCYTTCVGSMDFDCFIKYWLTVYINMYMYYAHTCWQLKIFLIREWFYSVPEYLCSTSGKFLVKGHIPVKKSAVEIDERE